MSEQEFVILCNNVAENIRLCAPIDTGNLRYAGVRYEFIDEKTCRFYVDEKIAPYMKYTNENWNLFRPPLHGKKNKNEGWWTNDVFMAIINTIKQQLADKIVDEEG